MKKLLTVLLLSSSLLIVGCGDDAVSSLSPEDIVVRQGIAYRINSTEPFSGKIVSRYSLGDSNKLGQIKEQYQVKDGKAHGERLTYHTNGQLKRNATYEDGVKNGPFVSYHGNGQIEWKGDYEDGKKDDTWAFYHENGKLRAEGDFKNGKRGGTWVSY